MTSSVLQSPRFREMPHLLRRFGLAMGAVVVMTLAILLVGTLLFGTGHAAALQNASGPACASALDTFETGYDQWQPSIPQAITASPDAPRGEMALRLHGTDWADFFAVDLSGGATVEFSARSVGFEQGDSLVLQSSTDGNAWTTVDTWSVEPEPMGSIGDFVWLDLDASGLQDPSEQGISDVHVVLTDDATGVTTLAITDADGAYTFAGLPAGLYTVTIDQTTLPAGVVPTFDADGGQDSTSVYDLSPGEDNDQQDFGYTPLRGSIGDRVWLDLSNNGVQDPNEPGIDGVTVTLTSDTTGDTKTATTSGGGLYYFPNLLADAYTVTIDQTTLPAGAVPTYDQDGGQDSTSVYDLAPGENNDQQDFGYFLPGSIGDRVWLDVNDNGQQDRNEQGINGVTVTLTSDTTGETNVTTTSFDGYYSFSNLVADTYTVTIDQTTLPAGLFPSYDPDGGQDSTSVYDLSPGEDNDQQDFGYTPLLGSIGDYVWLDLNGDGIWNAGEQGIDGVTVTLTSDTTGETNVTTTDAGGFYSITALVADTYTVTIDQTTLPAGVVPTYDADGGQDSTSVYALAPGENNDQQNFGYFLPGSIGDYVWLDLNGNGIWDSGEQGIDGVVITLTGDTPGVTTTAVTANDGAYNFDYLIAGTYTVTVDQTTLPANVVPTYDADGFFDSTSTYTLAPGENNDQQDFGYAPTGSSGDAAILTVNPTGHQLAYVSASGSAFAATVTSTTLSNTQPERLFATLPASAADTRLRFVVLGDNTDTVNLDDICVTAAQGTSVPAAPECTGVLDTFETGLGFWGTTRSASNNAPRGNFSLPLAADVAAFSDAVDMAGGGSATFSVRPVGIDSSTTLRLVHSTDGANWTPITNWTLGAGLAANSVTRLTKYVPQAGTFRFEASGPGSFFLDDICVNRGPEQAPNMLRVTSTCLGGNGRIEVNVVNTGATADYELQIGTLAPRARTLAPKSWWRSPVTGRPDGPIQVTLTRDGVTVLDQTVTVACDVDETISMPEVDILNWCINGRGIIWVQFANPTPFPRSYVIDVGGIRRSTTAYAFSASRRGVSGRPNGTYIVKIESLNNTYTEMITVDC